MQLAVAIAIASYYSRCLVDNASLQKDTCSNLSNIFVHLVGYIICIMYVYDTYTIQYIHLTLSPPYLYREYICCMTGVHSCKLLVSEWIPNDGMLII